MLTTDRIHRLILGEREYQQQVHPEAAPRSVTDYLLIADGELIDAKRAWQKNVGSGPTLIEMVQTAATCVACLEAHGDEVYGECQIILEQLPKKLIADMSPLVRARDLRFLGWGYSLGVLSSDQYTRAVEQYNAYRPKAPV